MEKLGIEGFLPFFMYTDNFFYYIENLFSNCILLYFVVLGSLLVPQSVFYQPLNFVVTICSRNQIFIVKYKFDFLHTQLLFSIFMPWREV